MNYDALEQLVRLRDSGALTPDEFEKQKARLLSDERPSGAAQRSNAVKWIGGAFALLLLLGLGALYWVRSGNNQSATGVTATNVSTVSGPTEPAQEAAIPTRNDAAEPTAGNCHMGNCAWWKVLEQKLIQTSPAGSRLYRLRLLGGDSDDSDSPHPVIKWNQSPHYVWVFCSKTLPTTMIEADGSWQTTILDFRMVPDVLIDDALMYEQACFGKTDADWDSLSKVHTPLTSDPNDDLPEIDIKEPTDIIQSEASLQK